MSLPLTEELFTFTTHIKPVLYQGCVLLFIQIRASSHLSEVGLSCKKYSTKPCRFLTTHVSPVSVQAHCWSSVHDMDKYKPGGVSCNFQQYLSRLYVQLNGHRAKVHVSIRVETYCSEARIILLSMGSTGNSAILRPS